VRRSGLKLRPASRVIHRPGRGHTQIIHAGAAEAREHTQRVHVRMLALRRTHAHRAVALEQLARIESLTRCIFEIFHLQIFIEVDEVFGLGMIDDGEAMRGAAHGARDGGNARGPESRMGRGERAGARAVGKPRVHFVHPVQPSGRKYSRRQKFRHELLQFRGKRRAAAGLREQLRRAHPSDTHQYRIAVDSLHPARAHRGIDPAGCVNRHDVEPRDAPV